jgi:hypothetical protein
MHDKMEFWTKQVAVNTFLSSISYACILYQFKIHLLKTGEPFNDINSKFETGGLFEIYEENRNSKSPIGSLGGALVGISVIAYGFYFIIRETEKEISDNWLKSIFAIGLCIGMLLLGFFFIINILIGLFEIYEENRNKRTLKILIKGIISHIVIFEVIAYAIYSAVKNTEARKEPVIRYQLKNAYFRDFIYDLLAAHICAFVSYLLALLLLLFWVKTNYVFRIIVVLICLFYFMSGVIPVFGWEF